MHRYERWILRRYLANALKTDRFATPPRFDADIVGWIDSYARSIALPKLEFRFSTRSRAASDEKASLKEAWKAWRAQAVDLAEGPAPRPPPLCKDASTGSPMLVVSPHRSVGYSGCWRE